MDPQLNMPRCFIDIIDNMYEMIVTSVRSISQILSKIFTLGIDELTRELQDGKMECSMHVVCR